MDKAILGMAGLASGGLGTIGMAGAIGAGLLGSSNGGEIVDVPIESNTLNVGDYMQQQLSEEQPLLQDDVIVEPVVRDNVIEVPGFPEMPSNYIEMNEQEFQQALDEYSQQVLQYRENNPQQSIHDIMIRMARQVISVVPVEYRVRVQQFLYDAYQNPGEFIQRCINLLKGARNVLIMGEYLYLIYKQKEKFYPPRDQMTDSEFMEMTQETELPSHCQRYYYRENGILKSRVLCKLPNENDKKEEMEAIDRDLARLAVSQKEKFGSVMDLLGADADSSFYRCKTYQLVQDTYHISVGGQTVGENANIQIQIDDDDTVHYLDEYCIVADLYCNGVDANANAKQNYVENYAALFEGYELQIGDVTWSFPQSRYYVQQKLSKMGKAKLEKYAKGLGIKYQNFAEIYNTNMAIVNVPTGANPVPSAMDLYVNYCRQLLGHSVIIGDKVVASPDGSATMRNKIVVPLSIIFPCLQQLPDDGAVVTCLGQKIKMTIRTNQANQCVSIGGAASPPTYQLKNCALFRSYTKLDAIRRDIILKSTVEYPKLNYQLYPINTVTPTMVPLFPISQKDRVRGVIFAFHSNVDSASIADLTANNVAANLLNNTPASYKNPLTYFPQLPIQSIAIQFSGETYTLNMPSIQPFHLSPHLGDQLESYTYPIQNALHWAYYLDLTRWGEEIDLYGSSSNQVTSIQLQIQLVTDSNSSTLPDQPAEWTSANLQNFQMVAYLETQRMFEQRNGLFQMQ